MIMARTLRQLESDLGISYYTLRKMCRTNEIEYSRLPSGMYILTARQIDRLLKQLEGNGNAAVGPKTSTES